MFPANRRKIREVDVEVVTPGRDDAITPASSDSGAFNGQEPPSSTERPSTTEGEPLLSSLFSRGVRRVRPKHETAPPPFEDVSDQSEETEQKAIEETAPAGPTSESEAETPRADEEPRDSESRVEERIQDPPAPAAPRPRTKGRLVWKATPTPTVQRAHTLKLTKTAPTATNRTASVKPKPVATPPAEKPPSGEPPRIEQTIEETLVTQDARVTDPVTTPRTPAPPATDVTAEETPAAPETPAEQTCDILFWRGYRKAAFFGRTFDETGEAVAVAESPFFRPQGNGAPDPTEAAKAAYEALRSQLIAEGWEPIAAGDDWFDETFRLTAAAEPGPE